MNYLSAFTNDEIHEAKKCFLNHLKRPIEIERMESPKIKGKKEHQAFSLNIHQVDAPGDKGEEVKQQHEEQHPVEPIEPKTRAAGGVWI